MKIAELTTKSITILGMGREGQSTWRYLRLQFPDKQLTIADQKPFESLDADFQALITADSHTTRFFGANYLESSRDAQVICKTAGIPKNTPEIATALERGAQLSSNAQLFFDVCVGKTIGVTGTKGKSTTATSIYTVLKYAGIPCVLTGNIGQPPLESLPQITPETWVVLELSSHQLAELTTSPHIAVVQAINADHLDYYPTVEDYADAKAHITRFQRPEDFVFYFAANEQSTRIAHLSPGTKIAFGGAAASDSLAFASENTLQYRPSVGEPAQAVLATQQLPLLGAHNVINVMPAVCIAKHLGISTEILAQALKTLQPLDHRLQFVGEKNGVRYINDSLSTTPEAAVAALNSFPNSAKVLLAGGFERHLDFLPLAKALLTDNIRAVILFPTTGKRIWDAVTALAAQQQKANLPPVFFVETMSEAVAAAHEHAQPGDVVLLSPASASFAQFKDYAERGEAFEKCVGELR